MKKISLILALVLIFSLLLVACDSGETPTDSGAHSENAENKGTQAGGKETQNGTVDNADQMFTERDSKTDYNPVECVGITLNGNSIACSSKTVTVNGTTATINTEGTYVITGELTNGMIAINAKTTDKVHIILNGVSITSATCAPIYVLQADKVFVTLANNTENVLANGGSFTPVDSNNIDATIFSTQDITFNGGGKLTVNSPAGHGISTKDDLVIASGTYVINSLSRGVDANDSVRIKEASVKITSGKDSIRSENNSDTSKGFVYIQSGTIELDSKGDGISSSAYTQIEGGKITINAASSDTTVSAKAIKVTTSLVINGGTFDITSTDDAIKADEKIYLNGGTLNVKTDDDAISTPGLLHFENATLNIIESYEGIDAAKVEIDSGKISIVAENDAIAAAVKDSTTADQVGEILITGGEILIKAGGDGIDTTGTLTVTDGVLEIYTEKVASSNVISCDGAATISGGKIFGFGFNASTQEFSTKGTAVVSLSVDEQAANVEVTVNDRNGGELIAVEAKYAFSEIVIILPELVSDKEYTILVNDTTQNVIAK